MDTVSSSFAEIDHLQISGHDLVTGDCGIFRAPTANGGNPFPARIISIVRQKQAKQVPDRNIYLVVNLYLPEQSKTALRHLYGTERLFVLHSSAFLHKIWILPYWDYAGGMRPLELNIGEQLQNLFYFGLIVSLSRLESAHSLYINKDGIYRIDREFANCFIPREYNPALVKISNIPANELASAQESVSKITSFPTLPSSYRFPCSKCRFISEHVSSVALHFLSHFNMIGTQVTELAPMSISNLLMPLPKSAQPTHVAGLHKTDYPVPAALVVENAAEVEERYRGNFQLDSNGKILWFKAPPLFIPFRRAIRPSLGYSIFRANNPKIYRKKRVPTNHYSNFVSVPDAHKLDGNSVFFISIDFLCKLTNP